MAVRKKSYYDPVKAHEYYMRTRQLKGRKKAAKDPPKPAAKKPKVTQTMREARERIGRLRPKIQRLETALGEAMAELSKARQNSAKTEKKNSDGKATAKERKESKEYRDRNQGKLAEKRKDSSESSSKSSSSSSSKSKSSSSSSSSSSDSNDKEIGRLEERVRRLKSALSSAKSQLARAEREAAGIQHSMLLSEIDSDILIHYQPIGRKESVKMTADFGGYATRSDVKCSDGRTILPDAFKEDDGQIVPLVFAHGHGDIENYLGHCKLENRPDGVYAHAYFNDTPKAQLAKAQVKHGDFRYLSIFANNLVEQSKRVMKGKIREVSLVMAGANPGAYIDNVNIAHSDGVGFETIEDEAYIRIGWEIDVKDGLSHADGDDDNDGDTETVEDVVESMSQKQKDVLYYLVGQAAKHSDDEEGLTHDDLDPENIDFQETLESLSPKQQVVVHHLISEALIHEESDDESKEDEDESSEAVKPSDDPEGKVDPTDANPDETDEPKGKVDPDNEVKPETDEAGGEVQHANTNSQEAGSMYNLFDKSSATSATGHVATLSKNDMTSIMHSVEDHGKLSKAIKHHISSSGITVDGELKHGIENIEYLFPDFKQLTESPTFLSRRTEWVQKVLNSVRRTPFAKIRTVHADITMDEARARGYVKGNRKEEEVFKLLRRETTPQTVYKKQSFDRDEIIDITEIDTVAWVKAEMKLMLDEEIASAILIGDGRSNGDPDKIKDDNIRPIATDDEIYTTKGYINLDNANSSIEELVDSVIELRSEYKGSGSPTFYTTPQVIAQFKNVKDNFGHRLYKSNAEIAAVLDVVDVVPVETFGRMPDLVGILVNLVDYNIGTDRGGQATMFDDFDLDYNKMKWLLETRLCGSLTLPKSAVAWFRTAASADLAAPAKPAFENNEVTVPTITGVTYKNVDTGVTLTTGSPVELDPDEVLNVKAIPASGYYFASTVNTEWTFKGKA